MEMRIVETWHHELFMEIDDARVWTDERFDFGSLFRFDRVTDIESDGDNRFAANCNHAGARMIFVQGGNDGVGYNQVCRNSRGCGGRSGMFEGNHFFRSRAERAP